MKKLILAAALLLAWTDAAFAAMRTVTLSVPGMYCSVCPITVKKALEKVPGVTKASTSLKNKEAIVTFDDTKATLDKLLDATFDAGYPSEVKGTKAK